MSANDAVLAARELSDILKIVQEQLTDINKLSGASTVSEASRNMSEARLNAYDLYVLTRRVLASFQRMGLPDDVEQSIAKLQKLVMVLHTLTIASAAIDRSDTISATVAFFSVFTQLLQMGVGRDFYTPHTSPGMMNATSAMAVFGNSTAQAEMRAREGK